MSQRFRRKKSTALLLGVICIWLTTAPAHADPDYRDVVRDGRGNVVVNSFHNCVHTRWMGDRDVCDAQPTMRKRTDIGQEERTVYFEFNKAVLAPEAVAKLNSLADTLKADDQVRQARIVGYADRIGTASYNERLSQKRAQNVRNYLISRGFINSRVVDTRWLGESAPATKCPDTLSHEELIKCLQKDRRVEVEIDYLLEREIPNHQPQP